ncbi:MULTISPECIES: hypothetical protein [Shewanella]|uniref:hypothetical protein n=1 Tax=Shewanella TaxID=22 RepID=UPI001C65E1FA|nr:MULTISPECIES: hypothetical protein [Shewanella]QYJ75987.1 hypothetical protein K0H79_03090 [Shewanella sp. FJAT-52076]QYK05906.1 hypothetical protein K0H63_03430 [Shewanella zhangzhouensis]
MFPYPDQYRNAIPPLMTGFIVLWALVGRAIAGLGSPVFYYPLLAMYPLILAAHVWLIWHARGMRRLDQGFYALVHCTLAFVVWTFAIMHLRDAGL